MGLGSSIGKRRTKQAAININRINFITMKNKGGGLSTEEFLWGKGKEV